MKKFLRSLLSVFLIVTMLSGSLGMLAIEAEAYSYIAHGIDVSAWQGVIDWNQVKASGVDFAILRIMASGKDRYFESNYTNAKAAGVKLGVYCYSYADTVAEAQAEANKVLGWLNGRTLEYPVYFDIEDPTVHANLTNAQRNNLCYAFCDVIQANGYRAGIYSGAYWFNSKLDRASLTAKYEIWEAMWPSSNGVQVNSPIYDKSSTCGMWQYSSTGSVPGISGRVDMNVSYKDYATYMINHGLNGYGSVAAPTVTPNTVNPDGWGWKWPANEAYGYLGNYGTNGQDIELSVDLCLLPSAATSVAAFYDANTSPVMTISPTSVTVGSKTVSYNWGTVSMDNWHDVKFKILNGTGYVYIDGKLIAFDTGITANTTYQLLFSLTGEMMIDNAIMMSSTGTTYFNCNFEDANAAQTLMGSGLGKRARINDITLVTPTNTTPGGYGWQWPASDAYGYMGNYGSNGQDIELSVDLALLPSSDGKTSVAYFYTNGTEKHMSVTPTSVTVGNTTVSYNWGEVSKNNWHNVKFKILNGIGYVFIDGVMITSESGITANTAYQLLFCYTGEMAIDNAILMSSTGTTYFNCNFEDASAAQKLMGEGLGARTLISGVSTVTPTNTTPNKWGWKWGAAEAYGYIGNYGSNGQDIELSVDLALLPSSDGKTSVAYFYTNGTEKHMSVTPTSVTVGNTTVSYNWGEVSLDNWHNVKFKILNGIGYVFIDGSMITSESGITANTAYQLLFCYTGQMAIDNLILMSSGGTTYVNCDFEDEAMATKLMGEGLGQRELLLPDKSSFNVMISAPQTNILGKGSIKFTATPTAGEGHSYSWSTSNSALRSYITSSGSTLTINIPSELASALSSTITCTVTSDGGVTSKSSVNFTYTPYPTPTIDSITPAKATITDTGSATFTVAASGDGLQYEWICSDSSLTQYITGADTEAITVDIPEALANELSAEFTCKITNSYGKTVTSSAVSLEYKLTPAPIEPERPSGDINGDNQITASDLNIAKRYVAGVYSMDEGSAAFIAADLNGDGMITAKDIGLLLKMLV